MRAIALAAALVAGAAGCSATHTGSGFGPVYTTISGLAAQLSKGTSQMTSSQGSLNLTSGPLTSSSTFSGQMSKGNVTAMDDRVNTTYQGKTTELHMIIVGGKVYVDRGRGGKPWVIATTDSPDPVVAQLATDIPGTLSQSGATQFVTLVSVGRDLQLIGPGTVDGVQSAHYHLMVDTASAAKKLPGNQGKQMQQAADAGVDTIPLDLWVDANGRAIKVVDKVVAEGVNATAEIRMGHFNEPVTISAPPPSQIASG